MMRLLAAFTLTACLAVYPAAAADWHGWLVAQADTSAGEQPKKKIDEDGDAEPLNEGETDAGGNAGDDVSGTEAGETKPLANGGSPRLNADEPVTYEIMRDLSLLPFPARKMHELLLNTAKAGDLEALRPFIGEGDDQTMLSFGGIEGDPIAHLKSLSGDPDGYEILAIMQEVLQTGFVRVEVGTENEMYVWPYYFATPFDKLTPEQKVEMFTLLTYGDFEEMESFGAYLFYRVGITPQGRWRFFVAGD